MNSAQIVQLLAMSHIKIQESVSWSKKNRINPNVDGNALKKRPVIVLEMLEGRGRTCGATALLMSPKNKNNPIFWPFTLM
jgi:hypothetical protein